MNPDDLAKAAADAAIAAVTAQIDKLLSGHPLLVGIADSIGQYLADHDAQLIAAVEAALLARLGE